MTDQTPNVDPDDQPIEPAVRFHVTETRNGETTLHDRTGYKNPKYAVEDAFTLNRDEVGMANAEMREVEVVYDVVKATTTYEPYTAPPERDA